jgi:flagellar biosynthesis/type III secretory pathway protein FliH
MHTATRSRLAASPLFTEDFDGPRPPRRAAAPSAPPPTSPEEIAAQLAAAYAEGLSAGIARAAADQDEMERRLSGSIVAGLEAARAEAHEAADVASTEIAQLLVTCLTTAFPALDERLGPAEAAAFAREILAPMYGEPQIALRCSPHAVPALEKVLAGFEEELRAAITITPTDAMLPGDVRITWGVAVARRDSRTIWRAMQEALAQAGVITLADIQEFA